MRPGQRRQPGLQYGIFLLLTQVAKFGIDRIPPATLIGVIIQVMLLVLNGKLMIKELIFCK